MRKPNATGVSPLSLTAWHLYKTVVACGHILPVTDMTYELAHERVLTHECQLRHQGIIILHNIHMSSSLHNGGIIVCARMSDNKNFMCLRHLGVTNWFGDISSFIIERLNVRHECQYLHSIPNCFPVDGNPQL